jgi:hypothetical protein
MRCSCCATQMKPQATRMRTTLSAWQNSLLRPPQSVQQSSSCGDRRLHVSQHCAHSVSAASVSTPQSAAGGPHIAASPRTGASDATSRAALAPCHPLQPVPCHSSRGTQRCSCLTQSPGAAGHRGVFCESLQRSILLLQS